MKRGVLSARGGKPIEMAPPVEAGPARDQAAREFPDGLLLAILDATNLAIYLKGADGRYLFVNRQYLELAQAPRAAILGRHDTELFPPDIANLFLEQDAEVTRRKALVEFEETLHLPAGVFSFITAKFPLLDAEGRVTAVGGVCTDITNRDRGFAESRAAERERLAVTLRSAGEGILSADPDGIVRTLNRAAEALSGWSQAEAAGRPIADVLRVTGRDGSPLDLLAGAVDATAPPLEATLERPDGIAREVILTRAPVLDRSNQPIGTVLVVHDETERLRMERELFRTHHLEALGLLAGGIAHDFNNLFMSMLGRLNLARRCAHDPDKLQANLDASEKAIHRARDLIRQLVTFSRGGEPVREVGPLDSLIRDSATFILSGSPVQCRFEIAADLHPVPGDRSQLSQVVQNLVLNARQAMPDGGLVRVRAANAGGGPDDPARVVLEVEDDGPGIPPEIHDRIFDPYFTTRSGGSGLGLAITHAIVARHGGRLSVDSPPGAGARFTVTLPAAK